MQFPESIQKALAALPPIWRSVVHSFMRGDDIPLIAAREQISQAAVTNILRLAREKLNHPLDRQAQKETPIALAQVRPSASLPMCVCENSVRVGRHTSVSFVRTLRVPQDGRTYALPVGFGNLPIFRVSDYARKVPQRWLETGGFFVPLYQREALYLEFHGVPWRPTIAKVSIGMINAITGKPFNATLRSNAQDYVVIPNQQWLDGINTKTGLVGQFVAMPLGQGYTVEEQITDEAKHGGFELMFYESKEGKFPDRNPGQLEMQVSSYQQRHEGMTPQLPVTKEKTRDFALYAAPVTLPEDLVMGIAEGGYIQQQIIVDPYGRPTWDEDTATPLHIHIVNSMAFELMTGLQAPPTPVTDYSYKKRGLPWYSNYDESVPSVMAAKVFKGIRKIFQIDQARGIQPDEQRLDMMPNHCCPKQTGMG